MRLLWHLVSALVAATAVLAIPPPPRVSPVPCLQAYVCPTPIPYPNTPDTGALPGPNEFKCRIGSSSSDADFAFCYYSKSTGALLRSTPTGIEALCWPAGMPNPDCAPGRRRAVRRLQPPLPRHDDDIPAARVSMGRFFPRRLAPEARGKDDEAEAWDF